MTRIDAPWISVLSKVQIFGFFFFFFLHESIAWIYEYVLFHFHCIVVAVAVSVVFGSCYCFCCRCLVVLQKKKWTKISLMKILLLLKRIFLQDNSSVIKYMVNKCHPGNDYHYLYLSIERINWWTFVYHVESFKSSKYHYSVILVAPLLDWYVFSISNKKKFSTLNRKVPWKISWIS